MKITKRFSAILLSVVLLLTLVTLPVAAEEAVQKCAEYLGIALTNVMKLFMPSILVCNMGTYMQCRAIWERAVDILQANMQKVFGRTLPVQEIVLKEKDVLAGMAIRICDKLFDVEYFQNI